LICFSIGLLRGAKVLVSQARGAGDDGSMGPYLGAALLSAGVLGSVTVVVGFGVADLLPSLASTSAAGAAAVDYFRVRMLSTPVLLVAVALREVRYGLGDSRAPMVVSIVANGLNIILNYVFIFELGLGVAGAAWATAACHATEGLLLAVVQGRDGFHLGGMRPGHVVAMWRLGVPSGGQFLLEMGAFAVLAGILSKLSELDMGAHMIAIQVLHFSFLPGLAIGEAASVMVGEAIGARRDELVRPVARLALKFAAVYAGACGVVFLLGGSWLARGFTSDPALIHLTAQLLVVAAVFQVFDAANIVARCVLRGIGDVRYPAVLCIAITWAITPPAAYVLGNLAGLGAFGAWLGLCVEIIAGAAALWWRLERGGWKVAADRAIEERERAGEEMALAS
jgi:MATE family multidrug resistance protein